MQPIVTTDTSTALRVHGRGSLRQRLRSRVRGLGCVKVSVPRNVRLVGVDDVKSASLLPVPPTSRSRGRARRSERWRSRSAPKRRHARAAGSSEDAAARRAGRLPFRGASVLRVAQIIDSRTARLLPCRATRLETSSRRICLYQDAPGAARVGSPKAGPLVSAEGLKVLDEYFAWRRQ